MVLSKEDQQLRKDRILGIVVEQYINTVTPVGSSCIVNTYPLDLSSATVRNILAELETAGYLTHPHTSAGRIPTEQGYRYYVDYLMQEIQFLEEEKKKIKAAYDRDSFELEQLLEKTSQIVSDVTHYTGIVSVDGSESQFYCKGTNLVVHYPDARDVTKIQNILRELEEKEMLLDLISRDLNKKIQIYIGHEMHCKNIDSCSLVVSRVALPSGQTGRIAVLGPQRMQYKRVVSTLDYLSRLIEELS